MLEKISIIIPTHNRHQYLNRILNYFSAYDLNIFVADTSSVAFSAEKFPQINYYHLPEFTYYQKIWHVLNHVQTPYVILCPDDDFTVPYAIEECIKFLESHPDYASAQGHSVYFHKKDSSISWHPLYCHFFSAANYGKLSYRSTIKDFNAEKPSERIGQLSYSYIYLHYSVHRKQNLIDTFKYSTDFTYEVMSPFQYFLDIISIINGKHKVLPVFYQAKEFIPISATFTSHGFHVESKEKLWSDYKYFFSPMVDHLLQHEQLNKERANFIIGSLILDHWYFSVPDSLLNPLKNKSIIKKIINLIPGIRLIKKIYSYTIRKFYIRDFESMFELNKKFARGIKGFPLSDKIAKRQWQEMVSFIKKYPI